MRDIHKQRVIQAAIREYEESVLFGFSTSTPHVINMMEEALYMCRPYNVFGISVLENILKEAKKTYEKELANYNTTEKENKHDQKTPEKRIS